MIHIFQNFTFNNRKHQSFRLKWIFINNKKKLRIEYEI